jgi:hypothetical protein
MKKFLVLPALLFCFNAQAGSLTDFADTFVQTKQDMISCDTIKSCTEVSFKYNTFVNHPDNQADLLRCEKNGKCYEVMMDVTMFMFTDFIPKLGEL